jgi:hypothetical protein
MPQLQHHLVGFININTKNHSVAEVLEKVLHGSGDLPARGASAPNVFLTTPRSCPALTRAAIVYADLEQLTDDLQREYGRLATGR